MMIMPLMMIALQVTTVVPLAVTPAKPAKPKLICEVVERMGSRIQADQVCITKEQWMQRRQDDRERLERNKINANGPSG